MLFDHLVPNRFGSALIEAPKHIDRSPCDNHNNSKPLVKSFFLDRVECTLNAKRYAQRKKMFLNNEHTYKRLFHFHFVRLILNRMYS